MKNSPIIKALLIFTALFFINGCSQTGRYQFAKDHSPDKVPPLAHLEDVHPHYEPYSRGGNKDYRVLGVNYKVNREVTSLTETGYASWYGNKFHGHLTSNGERYNMFAMSAAHKNLPLPCYVEVTNLENNKKITVRVNDRGPFHEGRIIDLSYAAAKKLEMQNKGTAKVRIKLIHFPEPVSENSIYGDNYYIQYMVTSSKKRADNLVLESSKKYGVKSTSIQKGKYYKLRLGPMKSEYKAHKLLVELQEDYQKAFIIYDRVK